VKDVQFMKDTVKKLIYAVEQSTIAQQQTQTMAAGGNVSSSAGFNTQRTGR